MAQGSPRLAKSNLGQAWGCKALEVETWLHSTGPTLVLNCGLPMDHFSTTEDEAIPGPSGSPL